VTIHQIKICKSIMNVGAWNDFNIKQPEIGKNRLVCERCDVKWEDLPRDQNVNVCMMINEINRCICDKCMSEIDQSLIIQ
jgi:hypothetical protein